MTRNAAPPDAENKLSESIRRMRVAVVAEFYRIERLGNTNLYRVTHPTEPNRCYTVDLYEGHCTCPAWREFSGCKHLNAVKRQTNQTEG